MDIRLFSNVFHNTECPQPSKWMFISYKNRKRSQFECWNAIFDTVWQSFRKMGRNVATLYLIWHRFITNELCIFLSRKQDWTFCFIGPKKEGVIQRSADHNNHIFIVFLCTSHTSVLLCSGLGCLWYQRKGLLVVRLWAKSSG